MSIKVRAVYDGKASLQLKEPLDLPADAEVEVTIEQCPANEKREYSFFKLAQEIAIDEGPTDFSTRYEEYLYPDPPRSRRGDEE